MATFSAQVDQWILESKETLEAVKKFAIQETFEQILTPWPVDTGFSKSSFTASTTGFTPLTGNTGQLNTGGDYAFVIANSGFEDTIYANFVANYAIHIEYGANGRQGKGLVRMAAQNWQQNVNQAVFQLSGK
jgi:hypothetical protein